MNNRLGSKDPLEVSEAAHPNDAYDTPVSLAVHIALLAKTLSVSHGLVNPNILDPGCGDFGTFGWAAREVFGESCWIEGVDLRDVPKRPWYDIQTRGNHLEHEWVNSDGPIKYSVIMGNPPFELAEEFVRHSIHLLHDYGFILFLFRMAWSTTVGRWSKNGIHQTHCFKRMYNLPKRPSWWLYKRPPSRGEAPVKTTNTVDYSVFYYTKVPWGNHPSLHVLNWDMDQELERKFRKEVGLTD